MSIIYDALKKVEVKLGGIESEHTSQERKNNPEQVFQPKVYLTFLTVIVVGFFSAALFYRLVISLNKEEKTAVPPIPTPTPLQSQLVPPPSPTIPEKKVEVSTTTPPKETLPQLILNGTFFSEEEGYALINNRIVKEGDGISGLIVQKINSNEVELKSKDSTIKISTSR